MKLQLLKPSDSLNKAYRKTSLRRDQVESFKTGFKRLFNRINEKESEENLKNIVADFLKEVWYKNDYEINTKDRKDLVVHNGKSSKDPVGIIIEAKKPGNKPEMISVEKPNAKALHELILYYLRERLDHNNGQIKHLIATNIWEWYIFDGVWFEKNVFRNKKLKEDYEDFKISGQDTRYFYDEIAAKFLDSVNDDIPCSYFDLKDYKEYIVNELPEDDIYLLDLYKIFSPEHLLTKSFINDSNSLNREFYTELLHIIGLGETKEKSKKLIGRKASGSREDGSILENTINILRSRNRLYAIEKPEKYGDTEEERLFSVGLELVITWLNRILFLKLLEGQLITYHQGDKSYSFMNHSVIEDFDQLNELFFDVLAIPEDQRLNSVSEKFGNLPYLNSSLFEESELERKAVTIAELKDRLDLGIHPSTVLKDSLGKRITGRKNTLEYFFEFLDAYDFSSDSKAEIQEQNKSLISASVLGLIFEKINGYKDGSFFTPGFITMYMSRETIRRAVVQKFNDAKGWSCKGFGQLYDKIEDKKEANSLINSLKICDPAVGSGHFLVSALNEIIAVKSKLKILLDRQGRTLRDYQVEVVNDELVITDDDGRFFRYNPNNEESRRIQEALFHEKQTIIENCLFGVDINPKSVMICRLRLWIELLKNAYYNRERDSISGDGVPKLETLPNLDINIKCGNSLISRFPLDANLGEALRKSKWNMDSYRLAVMTYRNAESKEQKRAMEKLIQDIKSDFETEVTRNDKRLLKLNRLKGELTNLTTQPSFFEMSKTEKAAWEKQVKKLTSEISTLESALEEIRSNKIYENAFEWRFEFPEVLDNDGKFVGFDVVIGNPPYMRVQEIQASQPLNKIYYEATYSNARASYDLANLFFELAVNISSLKSDSAFIFPHKFFNADSSKVFRDYLTKGKFVSKISHFGANMIFEDADTYTCVTQFSKNQSQGFQFQRFPFKSDFQTLMLDDSHYLAVDYDILKEASDLYGNNQWILFDNEKGIIIFRKIYNKCIRLEDYLEGIFVGLQTSKDELFVLDRISDDSFICRVPISGKVYSLEESLFKPFLMGKDVQRYSTLVSSKYVFFPYILGDNEAVIVSLEEIERSYPNTYIYLKEHESLFKAREKGKASKMNHWYAYIYPKNLAKFEQPKLSSMEICANHPNVTLNDQNFYHTTKVYSWVIKPESSGSYEYLLAISNSKLLWWFIKTTGDTLQGDARTFKTNYLNPFPLPKNVDVHIENELNEKVTEVLKLKKSDPKADTSALENEIDQLVYDLYGLTEEERRIVEGG